MSGYALALVLSLVFLVLLFLLLRTRRVREKYAAIWISLAVGISLFAMFPDSVFWFADAIGVEVPANLLFALAVAVLLAVSLQLSAEISSLEEETRTIAEEHALLEERVRELERHRVARGLVPPDDHD